MKYSISHSIRELRFKNDKVMFRFFLVLVNVTLVFIYKEEYNTYSFFKRDLDSRNFQIFLPWIWENVALCYMFVCVSLGPKTFAVRSAGRACTT